VKDAQSLSALPRKFLPAWLLFWGWLCTSVSLLQSCAADQCRDFRVVSKYAGPSKQSSSSSPVAPTSPTGYSKQPSPSPTASAAALGSAAAAGLPPHLDSGRAEQSGAQQQDTAAAAAAASTQPLPQQQQQQQPLASAFQGSSNAAGTRRSSSPGSAGQQVSKQSSQQSPSQQQGSSPGQRQRTLSGQLVSPTNSGNLPTVVAPAGRASFAIDALGLPTEGPLAASRAGGPGSGSSNTAGPPARATSGQPPLPPSAKQQLQQQQQNRQRLSPDVLEEHANHQGSSSTTSSGGGGAQGENSSGSHARRVRASMESCGSRASSARSGAARSTRSSFAMEGALEEAREGGDDLELDAYGRPSFAAFENTLRGRGGLVERCHRLLACCCLIQSGCWSALGW